MPLIQAIREAGAPKEGLWYIDLYPISSIKQIYTLTPEAAAAVSSPPFLQHHHPDFKTLSLIFGSRSVTNSGGPEWKRLRNLLSPGFSARNTMAFVPDCVDEALVTAARLSSIARGDRFVESSYQIMLSYTVAFLCRFAVGLKTECQTRSHPLTNLLTKVSKLGDARNVTYGWLFQLWIRWKLRSYEGKIRQLLRQPILERWERIKKDEPDTTSAAVVADLFLRDFLRKKQKEQEEKGGKDAILLDEDILDVIADNCRAVTLGGRDTTAATISWTLYELSKNPDVLEEVRREHSAVLGPDPDAAGEMLKAQPHLLNNLPWTTAVIKEVLRLYPPASGVRYAEPGQQIHLNGQNYPCDGRIILISHYYLHRTAEYFPNPNSFLPQRFLASLNPQLSSSSSSSSSTSSQDTTIDPNAYRPFERGIRNCPGQETAMLMIKVMLCVLVRKFRFEEAYEELFLRRKRRGGGTPPPGVNITTFPENGDRAYQVLSTAGYPKDGLPLWVEEEEGKERI
ncbi:hypothetical protein T310_0101 [Rasamsonia emersonii CBS 393.64]|uniref:Cytochrome P450 n=1 Tax=Rasamsonia emersonii (strain ATCC 16479 / CBS 393.64 / IMI 116815) TaxID=1408163 RepID=A0A0F4Z7R2_RASE3|nr:hypothetical protein T310_0101 [Rasamsonia emersonii CBS 393.64]KKA25898.1 hypothetical protein T310_0101 [Rasamsonia emersonii CBS 393.64]